MRLLWEDLGDFEFCFWLGLVDSNSSVYKLALGVARPREGLLDMMYWICERSSMQEQHASREMLQDALGEEKETGQGHLIEGYGIEPLNRKR